MRQRIVLMLWTASTALIRFRRNSFAFVPKSTNDFPINTWQTPAVDNPRRLCKLPYLPLQESCPFRLMPHKQSKRYQSKSFSDLSFVFVPYSDALEIEYFLPWISQSFLHAKSKKTVKTTYLNSGKTIRLPTRIIRKKSTE